MSLEQTHSNKDPAGLGPPEDVVLQLVRLLRAAAPGHAQDLVLRAARLHRNALVKLGYEPDALAPLDGFTASMVCLGEWHSGGAVLWRR
jgi:hypothetical protein